MEIEEEDMNGSQSDAPGVDDIIVFKPNSLHGATEWKFPQTLTCPMVACLREFRDRNTNIAHYRDVHLRTMTYCKPCNRPIGSKKFGNHLMSKKHSLLQQHAGAEHVKAIDECSSMSENESDHCTSSDTFSFFIVGKPKKIPWRFPQNSACPLFGCRLRCENRDAAVEHFRQFHADGCVYCEICESPLSVKLKTNVPLHYAKRHPTHILRPDWLQLLPKRTLNSHRSKESKPIRGSSSNDNQFENSEPSTSNRDNWSTTGSSNGRKMEFDSDIPVMIKNTKTVSCYSKEFKGNIIEETFQCITCVESFDQEDGLLNHLNMEHGSIHICIMCEPKQFMSHVSARSHYLENHQVFADKCPMCTEVFWDTETFRKHIMTHVDIKETPADANNDPSGGSIEVVYVQTPTLGEAEQTDENINDANNLVKQAAIEVPIVESDNDTEHSSDINEQANGKMRSAEHENREAKKAENGEQDNKEQEQAEKRSIGERETHKRTAIKREAISEKNEADKRAADRRPTENLENSKHEMEKCEVEKRKLKKRIADYDYFMYKKRMKLKETVDKPTARKSTAKPYRPRINLLTPVGRNMPHLGSSDSEESVLNDYIKMRNKNIPSTPNEEKPEPDAHTEDEKPAAKKAMIAATHDDDSTDEIKYCDPELQNLVDQLLSSPCK